MAFIVAAPYQGDAAVAYNLADAKRFCHARQMSGLRVVAEMRVRG
jgi:hypothetical protein